MNKNYRNEFVKEQCNITFHLVKKPHNSKKISGHERHFYLRSQSIDKKFARE